MNKLSQRQRALKHRAKLRLSRVRDNLAQRAADQARGISVLSGLQSVALRAGRDNQWVFRHIYGMAERRAELVRYGREAHFVPHGQPAVRSNGAQFCGRSDVRPECE